jgi:hypothetical protein
MAARVDLPRSDMPFTQNLRTIDNPPAACAQLRINEFCSGFGFVHEEVPLGHGAPCP